MTTTIRRHDRLRNALGISVRAGIALALAASLAGCGKLHRDKIVTGAIKDRVEINHPIRLGAKTTKLEFPVLAGASALTYEQREVVEGFAAGWDPRAGGGFQILIPKGMPNSFAAEAVAGDMVQSLTQIGVPATMMAAYDYTPATPQQSKLILLRTGLGAIPPVCGDYSENMIDNSENRHYRDFGCSTQANIAAMLDNPTDLLGPRRMTPPDIEARSNAIDTYRDR
ncbi:CpaD family pilus assembly lipoprotein [Notoacmeibacter sp. MSK16QG-6]|uniref:CpaD family pilus assembly protein n=1 Tax=Notoacmeibacter sp. MSK16QG-6 TaxID=2957982 RepID=UPI00209EFC68|nr:CpaD family pilus assembly lipoprotein [Notoacmeibacter sp. MSK16QG-6]MCP1198766.1 CpaD family pilus assembly lipoprotein [Notoacmeibacter sp. MSK16QG-6]